MKIKTLLAGLFLLTGMAFGQGQFSGGGNGNGVTPGAACGDATHALAWTGSAFVCQAITGSAAAGGSTTQVQFNNAGAFGGIAQFTTNGTTTITGGATAVFDMSAAPVLTGLKFPLGAGAAPTADGQAAFNTTTHLPVWGSNTTTVTVPTTSAAVGSNWLTSYNQVTGAFTKAQPAIGDISGTSIVVFNNQANTFTTGLQSMAAADYLQPVHAADPGTCTEGQIYENSVSHVMKLCSATNTWTALAAGGTIATGTSGQIAVYNGTNSIGSTNNVAQINPALLGSTAAGTVTTGTGIPACIVDGVTHLKLQDCVEYFTSQSLSSGVIYDGIPEVFATNPFPTSFAGRIWMGAGNSGTTCDSTHPICWVGEYPFVLPAGMDIHGVASVTGGNNFATGTSFTFGTNYKAALGTPAQPTLTCVGSGGTIASGTTIFVQVAWVNNLQTYTGSASSTATPGYSLPSTELSITCSLGANQSVTVTSPAAAGSGLLAATGFLIHSGTTSGSEVSNCSAVSNGCTAQDVTCGANGVDTTDPTACKLGSTATITTIATTATGNPPVLVDTSNCLFVWARGNRAAQLQFGTTLHDLTIAGSQSGSNTSAGNEPSCGVASFQGQEQSGIDGVNINGPWLATSWYGATDSVNNSIRNSQIGGGSSTTTTFIPMIFDNRTSGNTKVQGGTPHGIFDTTVTCRVVGAVCPEVILVNGPKANLPIIGSHLESNSGDIIFTTNGADVDVFGGAWFNGSTGLMAHNGATGGHIAVYDVHNAVGGVATNMIQDDNITAGTGNCNSNNSYCSVSNFSYDSAMSIGNLKLYEITGGLPLAGATSGTAKLTPPAVAGTATNQITSTNVLGLPNGASATPAYSFSGAASTGMFNTGTPSLGFATSGNVPFVIATADAHAGANAVIGFNNNNNASSSSSDAAFSRGAPGLIDLGTGAAASVAGYLKSGMTAAVTAADVTCGTGGTISSCVAATTITGLTFTLPLVATNWTMDCYLTVGQATATTANQWLIQTATNGVTNTTANYMMATAATALAVGAVTDQASTTTAFQIAPSWTLSGTATKMPVHIHSTFEGVSASGTVINLQVISPTVGDLLTIYRGSSCSIHP